MTSDAAIEGRLESGPTHRFASTNQRRSRATKPQRTTSAHEGQAARRDDLSYGLLPPIQGILSLTSSSTRVG